CPREYQMWLSASYTSHRYDPVRYPPRIGYPKQSHTGSAGPSIVLMVGFVSRSCASLTSSTYSLHRIEYEMLIMICCPLSPEARMVLKCGTSNIAPLRIVK